jgi:hypothetical protein
MFKAIYLALARYYRKAGDGSRKYINRLIESPALSGPDEESDSCGFVWMKDTTLRDDAPQLTGISLLADITAADLGSGPGAMVPLSIFDPAADDTSLEPDGLSASPGALVEEFLDVIAPREGGTGLADFPDRDLHDVLDTWVRLSDRNQSRFGQLIFASAARQIFTIRALSVLFAGLNIAVLTWIAEPFGQAWATAATVTLAALTTIAMVASFMFARDHHRIVTDYFKSAGSANSAVVVTVFSQRQEAIISDLQSRFDALNRTCLASPAETTDLATQVNNCVRLIFRDRSRLNRNRDYLRLSMRAVGMSYLARVSEDRLTHIGWPWQAGNIALGMVPRIGGAFVWLIALAAVSLASVSLSAAPLPITGPQSGFLAGQAAACIALFIVAGALTLRAHAQIMRPPITPQEVRQMTKEASLQTMKGGREAHVTSRFIDLLVLLLHRLRKEEDRRR